MGQLKYLKMHEENTSEMTVNAKLTWNESHTNYIDVYPKCKNLGKIPYIQAIASSNFKKNQKSSCFQIYFPPSEFKIQVNLAKAIYKIKWCHWLL